VIPVVTTEQMGAVDRAAPEPVEELVGRAGRAVATAAAHMLRGTYGRRVVIVAGPGNNGADGRAAGMLLAGRGVRVTVLDARAVPPGAALRPSDLVIDAAYGTGFHGRYQPPDSGATPVLAVDIPSGVAGDTGQVDGGQVLRAERTVTFQAYKPGLLLGEGPALAGEVQVADIGLGPGVTERCTTWLVTDDDVAGRLPARPRTAHKWQSAVLAVAGSPGMLGAPTLVSRGALRAGAGYVRLGVPGVGPGSMVPSEAVGLALPAEGWAEAAAAAAGRCRALVIGPGLGRGPAVTEGVRRLLELTALPAVVDADGLNALGGAAELAAVAASRPAPTIITPHEGEFARLFGAPVGPDRLSEVRKAAASTGSVVLLKGPTTIVSGPDGRALLAVSGSPRLASAGTGDVLSGIIAAFLARGADAFTAPALAAHAHGRAAREGLAEGLVAGDLPDLVARWLSEGMAGSPR
jgi:NAD(P)H-hydrate epimerase